GFNKRQRQELKFRKARDDRTKFEVTGDDAEMEKYFGSAYTEKGKVKGTKRGTGMKNRKFVNMYGFDPNDFSVVRFVDPLTGATIDDTTYADVVAVQERFTEIRNQQLVDDLISSEAIRYNPKVYAYYIKNKTSDALKVELTPHNPFRVSDKTNTIAGFPEKAGILRQTGTPEKISMSEVPISNEVADDDVTHE
nr:VPg [Lupinus mosaic virus]